MEGIHDVVNKFLRQIHTPMVDCGGNLVEADRLVEVDKLSNLLFVFSFSDEGSSPSTEHFNCSRCSTPLVILRDTRYLRYARRFGAIFPDEKEVSGRRRWGIDKACLGNWVSASTHRYRFFSVGEGIHCRH